MKTFDLIEFNQISTIRQATAKSFFVNLPYVVQVMCCFCAFFTFLPRGRHDILSLVLSSCSIVEYVAGGVISMVCCKFLSDYMEKNNIFPLEVQDIENFELCVCWVIIVLLGPKVSLFRHIFQARRSCLPFFFVVSF